LNFSVLLFFIFSSFSQQGDRLGVVIELKTDYAIYAKFTLYLILTESPQSLTQMNQSTWSNPLMVPDAEANILGIPNREYGRREGERESGV
jgi:hypothetical protein